MNLGVTLSFNVEDGEAIFAIGILDGFYQEALKEAELARSRTDEDAKEDAEDWTRRATRYKKMIDELERYIETEANKVWVFVKTPPVPAKPKVRMPRKSRITNYVALPCTYCGSTNTVGSGYRKTKYGTVPKRDCRDCGKKYTNLDSSLFKMKFPKEIIERAVKLVGDGLSLRDVADFIKREYHVKVSHVSIKNWMKREKMSAPVVNAVVPPVKPELEMFRENDGFDYRSKHPKRVGSSEIYHSGTGKIVIRHRGKGCRGEIVLATEKDIEKLLSYAEKDFEWCIKNLNHEKRNILRGYLRDLRCAPACK